MYIIEETEKDNNSIPGNVFRTYIRVLIFLLRNLYQILKKKI